ncbi:MAG: hypothetical protein KJZ56_09575 [Flavobacteriales bacterium]|nr:hypothetical protein [Flavobacteriales bacterium]
MKVLITKKCENPKCKLPAFKTDNLKKKYHDVHCKNQANYWYKVEEYAWEILMQKIRKNNIKALKYLYSKNFIINSKETLMKLGFNFNFSYIHYSDDAGNKIFRFGNLGLMQIAENPNPKYDQYKIVPF